MKPQVAETMNIIPRPGKPIAVTALRPTNVLTLSSGSALLPNRRIIIPIDKRGMQDKREIWRSYFYKVGEPSWIITDVLFPPRYKIGKFKKIALAEKQNALKKLFDVRYVK